MNYYYVIKQYYFSVGINLSSSWKEWNLCEMKRSMKKKMKWS